MKQQNLDASSPIPQKCSQVILLTQIMTSCSRLRLNQPWRWLISSNRSIFAIFHPWELEFTWLSLSGMKKKRQGPLYIMIYAEKSRGSYSHIVLNFLSRRPYEHLNPGFPGNSHLLSVMGISMPCMGKGERAFFVPATVESNRNVQLCSYVMIKVNELSINAEQSLQHAL